MSVETWGLLSKSQIDNETIEEAIARLIQAHEDDPNAHVETGESLESHKASVIIDHAVNSIVEDIIKDAEVTSIKMRNVIDDRDGSVAYTGSWAEQTVGVNFFATRNISNTPTDYFEITFDGDYIGLFIETAASCGKVDISVDAGAPDTIDLFTSYAQARKLVWSTSGLGAGPHTLKCEIRADKNASATDYNCPFDAYTTDPGEALKLQHMGLELYAYSTAQLTDANGYKKFTISTPAGYSVVQIVGMRLSEADMGDADTTDPKLAWRGTNCYLYNGKINTTFVTTVTLLISKN